jgi:hypothetical protein
MAMSNGTKELNERESIEAMLPWYARGQLGADDERKVEAYLADHPEIADQLALIEEERGETTLLNEARGVPSPGALDRLMDSIEAHEAANPSLASTKKAVWGWASRLVGAPVPARLQWVVAAAAILIIAQGVSLGVLLISGSPQEPGYETASGPARSVSHDVVGGTYALVQFADEAKAADINGLLTEMGFTVVEGPKPGGVYKIRISDKNLDIAERDTILKELQAKERVISFVMPAE